MYNKMQVEREYLLPGLWYTVFHEYLAGIIFSEFVILEISRVFNLAIPKIGLVKL